MNILAAAVLVLSSTQDSPLHIEGAGKEIVKATRSGPSFSAPELFPGVEDFHNPRIKKLRDQEGLEKVVAGEENEFLRLLKLRHWVHSQWPIDNDQRFSGDAFAILERAKAGDGFHCAHSMRVQQAVMTSMGYVARNLGVDCDHRKFGRSRHHGVNEVWSNGYAKWVLLDAKYDIHFERDSIPLSALEVHEAVRSGKSDAVMVRGIDRKPVPMAPRGAAEATIESYWWIAYHVRQNTFTQPHWSGGSRLVVPDNKYFRETTWHRGGSAGLVKHWAYRAKAFIPTANRRRIEWTPGVPSLRVRQASTGTLSVRIRSATPNFKTYLVRVNGGDWKADPDGRLAWELKEGKNTLEVRSRNLFGVDSPQVSATVTFAPGTKK